MKPSRPALLAVIRVALPMGLRGHVRGLKGISLISGLALLMGLAMAPGASARTLYVADSSPGAASPGSISAVSTATSSVEGKPIPVEIEPLAMAITPDGSHAYVTNFISNNVSIVNTATNAVESTVPVGSEPIDVAITPNGKFAYVVNEGFGSRGLSVINTATNKVEGGEIDVGGPSSGIAVAPDGSMAYIYLPLEGKLAVLNMATNTVEGEVPGLPQEESRLAINPDGRHVYVSSSGDIFSASGRFFVVNASTNKVEDPVGISTGTQSDGIAISPDGSHAYIANEGSGDVSVINTATNKVEGEPSVGLGPQDIAISPDGRSVYVANGSSGNISMINAATNLLAPSAISVGDEPVALAITPDQPPAADFSAPRARPGVPLTFNTSASKDPDSPIATYAWGFGDGQSQSLPSPQVAHAFANPGTYQVSLKETDAEGCSTPETFRFTGQTAYCNGNAKAQTAKAITVAYPGVSVRCPKSAKPKGCAFKLQAVAKKPKKGKKGKKGKKAKQPKPESAIAKAKLKAGRSAIVSLVPTAAANAKLATAQSILVKETVVAGHSKKTRFVKLAVVQ